VFGLNPGLVKSSIRSNLMGEHRAWYRFTEALIGLFIPTADTYAERITPLLVSPDLDGHSAVMFDRKGNPVLPSPKLTNDYIDAFMIASAALLARTSVRLAR